MERNRQRTVELRGGIMVDHITAADFASVGIINRFESPLLTYYVPDTQEELKASNRAAKEALAVIVQNCTTIQSVYYTINTMCEMIKARPLTAEYVEQLKRE